MTVLDSCLRRLKQIALNGLNKTASVTERIKQKNYCWAEDVTAHSHGAQAGTVKEEKGTERSGEFGRCRLKSR